MFLPHLLGNNRLRSAFASIPADKLGSSLMIDGPSGIGKLTAAKDLAATLLCSGKDRPCGVCRSCRLLAAGSNSDFEVFGDTEAVPKIEDVRALRSRSFIRSGESDIKVFVIANADRLNPQSQNALLKVLEEPCNSVFILTCENYLLMLQTVRSRCTIIHLEPLADDIVRRKLHEDGGHTDDEINRAVSLCEGRLGYARRLLEKGEPAPFKAAQDFSAAIGDELALYRISSQLSALPREDYTAFLDRLSFLLAEKISRGEQPDKLVKIYDYLDKQSTFMSQNPSVNALCGALTAICGNL